MIKIGMIIGDRYEILEKIGTGGMSDVYKAKCHKLNRFVAIKVLKQEFSSNENFVSKFRVEAQAAAGLTHPNIVNVYDVGEEDGIYYIVMELVEGITLKNYIEKKARLSVKEAISIAIQVSMGIEAAHNNHIIHRDIKPQNIMISKEGKVKIADFGIAKAATSNTITSNVMGSVHYTSPEQARGGFSDERSDIYSLGCTMFEMLTGRVPFDGETTVAIAIKHIQEEMPSPREYVAEIPVCVEKIIFKCCQKSPDRRYQSMGELITDLKKSLITPEEDFVKMVDVNAQGETKVISENDIRQIKQNTDRIDLGEQMRLKDRQVESVSSSQIDDPDDMDFEDENMEEENIPEYTFERQEKESSSKKHANIIAKDSEDENEDDEEDEEYDDDYNPKMEKITTILAIVAAVIIGIIALVLAGKALGIFGESSNKENNKVENTENIDDSEENSDKVIMINVVGMDIESAKSALNEKGLGSRVTRAESDEYEEGIVSSQSIAEGEEIDKYSTIDLVVSTGINGIQIEDVKGLEESAAKDKLSAQGFKVDVSTQSSSDVDAGLVISQSPDAGSRAEKGARISIVVSSGPEILKTKVPDLRGMTEDAAKSQLSNNKLKCGKVSQSYSDTVTEGCVISQSYSPGSEVDENTTVNIEISIGPEKHTYKYVGSVDAPSGYTGGDVTITIKASDGDVRTIQTNSFPCAINEGKFNVASGTLTYTFTTTRTESSIDSETGEETTQEVSEENVTSPIDVKFAQE